MAFSKVDFKTVLKIIVFRPELGRDKIILTKNKFSRIFFLKSL